MKLRKIISGGQTGADQAGLFAAEELGLETGGSIPYGARTDDGPNFELVRRFGLDIHPSSSYPPRTEVNVVGSDGTVIFGNPHSSGCSLTIRLCKKHHKQLRINPTASDFRDWLVQHSIEILNVAGNRERTNPGIFDRTKKFIVDAIRDFWALEAR